MVATRRAGGQRPEVTIAQSGRTRTPPHAPKRGYAAPGEGARPTLRRPRTAGEDERLRGPVHRDDAWLRVHEGHGRLQGRPRPGERDGSKFEFTVTVTADDIDRLIADPAHEALLRGTITAPMFSPTPLRVEAGRFNLLVSDADTPGHSQDGLRHAARCGRRPHVSRRGLQDHPRRRWPGHVVGHDDALRHRPRGRRVRRRRGEGDRQHPHQGFPKAARHDEGDRRRRTSSRS